MHHAQMGPILVAYDGSEQADRAFDQALLLARERHRALHVLAVACAPEVETEQAHELLRARCWELLNPLRERAAAVQVDAALEVAEGFSAWCIPEVAKRLDAELIVMGHRQRDLLHRVMEGSLAKRVLDHSPCAVMVVP
jgi:nucleotide-binding universal stress UspA family protein